MKREVLEPGWYWVRDLGGEWEIAECVGVSTYDGGNIWMSANLESATDDGAWSEIGERIPPRKEREK